MSKASCYVWRISALARRCSLDPHYRLPHADDWFCEELAEELDDRLMSAWPGDWPGRQVVDLDSTVDPGAWLASNLGEPCSTYLFGVPMNDLDCAEALGESYLETIREQGYPLPPDFGNDPRYDGWTKDGEAMVRSDFAAFLDHWRERVVATLEKQVQSNAGESA